MSPTTTQPVFEVEQTTDSVDLTSGDDTRVIAGDYLEPGVDPSQVPRANLSGRNESGVLGHILAEGKEAMIRRHQEDAFPGIVDEWLGSHAGDVRADVSLIHKGYHLLRQSRCDPYTFDEDGDAKTTRDAVVVNPWNPFVFREHGGSLDEHGEPNAVHGLRPDQLLKHAIGTQFALQLDFRDNRWFLHSQATATDAGLNVYQDEETGDGRPKLQRVRNAGDGFAAGDKLESIPLNNGAPERGDMGDVSTVTVILIGELNGAQDPTLKVCRDARSGTRTYTSVSLSRTDNYNGSSLSKWEGQVDLTGDGASDKDDMGLEITIPGSSGDSDSTKLHYGCVLAVTTSDTGVTEGTIETYSNPATFTAGDQDWVEADYLGDSRLKMVQKLHKSTEADANTNRSPHWDIWIDAALNAHLEHRRGSDINRTYSPGDNLTSIEHERYGGQLAFRAWGEGAGKSEQQIRTADSLSDTDFANGGLKLPSNDPATADTGELARTVVWENPGQENPGQLLRETRAYLRIHSEPRKSWQFTPKVEGPRFYEPGDGIPIDAPEIRSTVTERIVELKRSWNEDEPEVVDAQLGQSRDQLTQSFVQQVFQRSREAANRPQPGAGTTGLSGPGIHFDKDIYGVLPFTVSDGASIERVLLEMTTAPFEVSAKGARGSSPAERIQGSTNTDIWNQDERFEVAFDPYSIITDVSSVPQGTYDGGEATANINNQVGVNEDYEVQITARKSGETTVSNPRTDAANTAITLSQESDGAGGSPRPTAIDPNWGGHFRSFGSGRALSVSNTTYRLTGDLSIALVIKNEDTGTGSNATIVAGESITWGIRLNANNNIEYFHVDSGGTEQTVSGSTQFTTEEDLRIYVKRDTTNGTVTVWVKGDTNNTSGSKEIDAANYGNDPAAGEGNKLVLGKRDEGGTNETWVGDIKHLRGWTSLKSDSFMEKAVDEDNASFSDLQNTLNGDEQFAFFFEKDWTDTQTILFTDTSATIADTDDQSFNVAFTSDDVDVGGSIKFYVVGQKEITQGQSASADTNELGHGAGNEVTGTAGLQVQSVGTHEHDPKFGIYQYDGDSSDGTGTPVYAKDLQWGVDVSTDSAGIPNDWANEKHPLSWGKPGGPQTVRVDVTGWLTKDSNGVVKNGVHHLYLLGTADGANDNPTGLGRVRATPVIVRKERERA